MCAGTKLACVAVTAALATALAVFALVAIVNKQQPSGDGLPAAETALRGQMTREQIEKAVRQVEASAVPRSKRNMMKINKENTMPGTLAGA